MGIHIRRDSLTVAAARLIKDVMLLSVKPKDTIQSAFFYFFNHTFFDLRIENAANLVEILLGTLSNIPPIYPTFILRSLTLHYSLKYHLQTLCLSRTLNV